MKKILFSLAFSASLISQAADLDNKPDVSTFDIAGVRLGMSLEEAQAALNAKYPNGEMGKVEMSGSPFDYATKIPNILRLKDGNQSITVYFSTNTLHDKQNDIVVSRIIYSLPRSDENLSALQTAAKEKYGEATLGGNSSFWRWCQHPEKVVSYECPSHKAPSLLLSSLMSYVSLDLNNPEYIAAEKKALEAAKTTKPSI